MRHVRACHLHIGSVIGWLEKLTSAKIKDGVRGEAVVLTASMWPGPYRATSIEMRLQITVPGEAPYRVKKSFFMQKTKYPIPGWTLPVTVDRNDPEKVRIEWDETPTNSERLDAKYMGDVPAAGTAGPTVINAANLDPALKSMVLDALSKHGIDAGALGAAAPPTGFADDGDPYARLTKLAELRDAGVITASDFEEQKKRILREV